MLKWIGSLEETVILTLPSSPLSLSSSSRWRGTRSKCVLVFIRHRKINWIQQDRQINCKRVSSDQRGWEINAGLDGETGPEPDLIQKSGLEMKWYLVKRRQRIRAAVWSKIHILCQVSQSDHNHFVQERFVLLVHKTSSPIVNLVCFQCSETSSDSFHSVSRYINDPSSCHIRVRGQSDSNQTPQRLFLVRLISLQI